jgi:hypothetical protein
MTEQEERLLVRITFRKQVSDGNFGTEAAEVTFEDYAYEPEEQTEIARLLLVEARTAVHAELNHSPSPAVRRTVPVDQPPPPKPTDADPEVVIAWSSDEEELPL